MAKIKHNVVLIDISWTKKPDMEMGLQEFDSWEDLEKVARHWCEKHAYSTWKLKKKSVRTKKSKKT
jgi:hypothetical protein